MKTIIGPVAEGEFYFKRPYLNSLFWKKITESQNLSIVAPRRVGKSSFMLNLLDKNKKGYRCLYLITESINNPNEFFKKIYKVVITQLSTATKFKKSFADIFQRLDIKKISVTEIEFGKKDINYFTEIIYLCRELDDFDEKIVLLIDEYSQTIENIITDAGRETAKIFLHQCRELRQDPEVRSKISFVYTGSIGLENLVLSIDEPRSISDLGNFIIPPLSEDEARAFIDQIIDGEEYKFTQAVIVYLLAKLKWLLPFFLQVIMSEIENICIEKNTVEITEDIIERAFKKALLNRSYFDHWLVRLRSIFKGNEFSCAKEILNTAARNDTIDNYTIQDIADKYSIQDIAVIIHTLIHDGYIIRDEGATDYRFNSPLLQSWWLSNIVI